MKRLLHATFAFALCLLPQACGLTLLSEAQEIQMGLQAYPQETGKFKQITSGDDYRTVQRAMRRLTPFADRDVAKVFSKPFAWEVKLLDAPKVVNAWCLPGGKMAFYTGILPICQSETGIAVVMSHEIAHAVKRHGNQRVSQQMVLKGLLSAGAVLLGNEGRSEDRGAILAALGVGARYGVQLPFSRGNESEADLYGIELMVQAGYNPWEAVKLWERMAARGSGGPEFMSTHPDPARRARDIANAIPPLLQKYGKTFPRR